MIKKICLIFFLILYFNQINAQQNSFLLAKINKFDSATSKLHLLPYVGYNHYDKTMIGLCFYRNLFSQKDGFNWIVSPAIQSDKKIVGNANIYYQKSLKNNLIFNSQYKFKSYSFRPVFINQYINNCLTIGLKKIDSNQVFGSNLVYNKNGLRQKQYALNDTLGNPIYYDYDDFNYMFYLQSNTFLYKKLNENNLLNINYYIEFGSHFKTNIHNYLKTSINLKWQHEFDKGKYFKSSFFAGVFLIPNNESTNNNFFRNSYNNYPDYLFNQTLLGRNENSFNNSSLWSRQIFDAENNSMRFSENKFYNNKWFISQNNDISLPGFIPFKVYFDWCFTQEMALSNIGTIYFKPDFYYSTGLTLPLLNNIFEFFVPLVYSKNLYFNAPNNPLGFYGFKLNLNNLNPQKIKRSLKLEKTLEIF